MALPGNIAGRAFVWWLLNRNGFAWAKRSLQIKLHREVSVPQEGNKSAVLF